MPRTRRHGDEWDAPDATETRTGYVSGVTFQDRKVEYVPWNGLALCESCIVLGTVEEMERRAGEVEDAHALGTKPKALVVNREHLRWPGGVIPFTIHPQFPDRARVTKAIEHWMDRTVIRFVPLTQANIAQFRDFVHFVPVPEKGGCHSLVGRRGGRQEILLSPGCSLRQVMHEIGHAVGLYHEQSRKDRDRHVKINFQNVQAKKEHNFNQQLHDSFDLGDYDHASIMHYGAFDFSGNGKPTIESIPAGIKVGGAKVLSPLDVEAVRQLYKDA
jgi:astacin